MERDNAFVDFILHQLGAEGDWIRARARVRDAAARELLERAYENVRIAAMLVARVFERPAVRPHTFIGDEPQCMLCKTGNRDGECPGLREAAT